MSFLVVERSWGNDRGQIITGQGDMQVLGTKEQCNKLFKVSSRMIKMTQKTKGEGLISMFMLTPDCEDLKT